MRSTLALVLLAMLLAAAPADAVMPLAHCDYAIEEGLCGSVSVPLDRSQPSGAKIDIKFVVFRHTDRSKPSLGSIFVTSGGPGDSAINNRQDGYKNFAFGPKVLARRDLVLIDQRGVGQSGAIDCEPLQRLGIDIGSYAAVASCAKQLGASANLYGSADVAEDIEAVRAALGVDKFDYYGASYAGVDVQAYAARYPTRLRSAVLDSPVVLWLEDPWFNGFVTQDLKALGLICRRSASCSAVNRDPGGDVARLARRLRVHPVRGIGHDGTGHARHLSVTEKRLASLVGNDNYGFPVQAELPAAIVALRHGDAAPLLRLAAENDPAAGGGGGDPATSFSEGENVARFCADFEFAWDKHASPEQRRAQFDQSLQGVDPRHFAPFSLGAWVVGPPFGAFPDPCIGWPAPTRAPDPPVPAGTVIPDLPVLVLAGELDLSVPPGESAGLSQIFPRQTFVPLAESGHHTVFSSESECSRTMIARFLQTLAPGDTSCAKHPNFVWPAVGRFPVKVAHRGRGRAGRRSAARITEAAVVDAFRRSFMSSGDKTHGVGLRGGRFHAQFTNRGATLHLRGIRYARDLKVTGTVQYVGYRRLRGKLKLSGAVRGTLHVSGFWNDTAATQVAVSGRLEGHRVKIRIPAT